MEKVVYAQVSTETLVATHFENLVADQASGATVLFTGDVRNHDGDKQVTSLSYEAHPTAQDVLSKVAKQVADNYEINKVALAHRYGDIPIGECAFVVAVSAAHREPAFAACQQIVDEVKKQIPIWKHQVFKDGTDEWVNFA